MAELHVEPKGRGAARAWLLALIVLIVIAAVAWWVYSRRNVSGATSAVAAPAAHVALARAIIPRAA